MKIARRRNRLYDSSRFACPAIRVYRRRRVGKKSPRLLLKCGCCEERLEVYYDREGLEIGGVNGSIEDWQEILLPLLLPGKTRRKSKRGAPEAG